MNNVNIIGNLTRAPELRYTTGPDAVAVARMTVAVNSGYGEKKETSFIPVVVFGKPAENCEKYLDKGSKVAVSGRIKTGSYEKDGRTVYTTDVIASRVEFLGGGNRNTNDATKDVENANFGPSVGMPEGFETVDMDIPF